jgi:hypothetical protein
MTSSRNCELRFNLNLRSKTEMSDGAELSLLEVKTLSNFHWLCPNKCLAGNAAIGELKAIARTDSTWKI